MNGDNQLTQNSLPDPLSAADRAFLGYGGPGQPADWYSAMGMPGGMNTGAQGQGWAGSPAAPQQPMYVPQQQQAASTQPAYQPPALQTASTQPAYLAAPAGFAQQPNGMAIGQQVGQGGGVSPLMMQLLGSGGGGLWPLLMRYYLSGGGAGYQPAAPQQNYTPQDFVSQWQQMFGRK